MLVCLVMLTKDIASHFASAWVAAWNARDLPRILSHYADVFVMESPLIASVAGETSGVLRGKQVWGLIGGLRWTVFRSCGWSCWGFMSGLAAS